MKPPPTQEERDQFFDQLARLPDPYGYTLKANKDGSVSMVLAGKRGHTKGRPVMRVRGTFPQLTTAATEYLAWLTARGDMKEG